MLKIAHRGNLYGSDPEKENTLEAIFHALSLGFDVEIDIWVINDILYLGHSEPITIIDPLLLNKIGKHGWFHCKNLGALTYFKEHASDFNYFWHQEDDFTITSNGFIWTYPGKEVSMYSILVYLETPDAVTLALPLHGICSDNFLTITTK
jgi:hypothetical protein